MAVLIDPPRWPAHGTRFSHLVSDTSLEELFAFADAQSLPARAFDHDHYDVPERRYRDLVAAGAEPVDEKTLLRRLKGGGQRVRPHDRTPPAVRVLPGLVRAWAELLPGVDSLGTELLERWQEPHRHYHDVRHLAGSLAALGELDRSGTRTAGLALWFHDAVHTGGAGADEEASAELAVSRLSRAGLASAEVDEVARLVLLTIGHTPAADDPVGAAVVDADLSVLGAAPGRYHVYARDVRLEYPGFTDQEFAAGRVRVLETLISRDVLFHTEHGRSRWLAPARANLASERRRWQRLLTAGLPGEPPDA
ncbi:MAG: DUF4031 domain-containing protein [Propionicimonas sp.]